MRKTLSVLLATILMLSAFCPAFAVDGISGKQHYAGDNEAIVEGVVMREAVVSITVSDAINSVPANDENYYMLETDSIYSFEAVEINGKTAAVSTTQGMGFATAHVQTVDEIMLTGGSTVSFDWKVSSEENSDFARFYVNDTLVIQVSGEQDWDTVIYTASSSGFYKLRWEYYKSFSGDAGEDCMWIDNLITNLIPGVQAEGIHIEPAEIEILTGKTGQLTVVYEPLNAFPTDIVFTSENTAIAMVSDKGLVTALTAGTAIITAENALGHIAQAEINVFAPYTIATFPYHKAEIGGVYDFELGGEGSYITEINSNLKYAYGFCVELNYGDVATLVASYGENNAPSRVTMGLYNTSFQQLAYDDGFLNNPTIELAANVAGNYYIIISTLAGYEYDGGNARLTITGREPVHVTGLDLEPQTLNVAKGRYAKMKATLYPENNDFPDIIWTTGDSRIATVDEFGVVYAVEHGATTVTATSVNGGFSKTSTVIVGEFVLPEYDGVVYAYNVSSESSGRGFIGYDIASGKIESVMPDTKELWSAAYCNGNIYAYEIAGGSFETGYMFHVIDAATFTVQKTVNTSSYNNYLAYDMAYDFTTNTMYAVTVDWETGLNHLATINLNTGKITPVAELRTPYYDDMVTLGCDNYGFLYGIAGDSTYYFINKDTAALTKICVMPFGIGGMIQSMTFNNNDLRMYWFQMDEESSNVAVFDPATGEMLEEVYLTNKQEGIGAFVYANPPFSGGVEPIAAEGFSLNVHEVSLKVGHTLQINPEFSPVNVTNRTLICESNNPAVVTVDNKGNITAVRGGSAYVTVTTEDGGFTDRVLVTVTAPPISDIPEGYASITLKTDNVWGDGTGYQMLIDSTAQGVENGTIYAPMTWWGDAEPGLYEYFDYKIPQNADGTLTTSNVLISGEITIFVPEGVYDWVVTNPTPNDKIYVPFFNGIGDDYMFAAGYNYTFEVMPAEDELGNIMYDHVNIDAEYLGFIVLNPPARYMVTFLSEGGEIISSYLALEGEEAVAPIISSYSIEGYPFREWDTDFSNVQSDLTVQAVYYTAGDTNMDGKTNTGDAAYILQYAVNARTMTTEQLLLADINRDDKVNTGDAAAILRQIVSPS